jgi:hypothetical protein
MFGLLTGLVKKIKALDQNKMVRQALSNTAIQQEILDLNRLDQLYDKGIDSAGDSLGEYSPATIEGTANFLGKKQKGQRYDHITLNDTGEFYGSFIFRNKKDEFEIQADALKDGTDLTESFGNEIVGLTEENKSKLSGWLIEPIQKEIRKKLL